VVQGSLLTVVAGTQWPLQVSAIIAAVLLFAVPAVFLGMVSPYIIQVRLLDYQDRSKTGTVMGRFFALSRNEILQRRNDVGNDDYRVDPPMRPRAVGGFSGNGHGEGIRCGKRDAFTALHMATSRSVITHNAHFTDTSWGITELLQFFDDESRGFVFLKPEFRVFMETSPPGNDFLLHGLGFGKKIDAHGFIGLLFFERF
jgi:hypothetical protein